MKSRCQQRIAAPGLSNTSKAVCEPIHKPRAHSMPIHLATFTTPREPYQGTPIAINAGTVSQSHIFAQDSVQQSLHGQANQYRCSHNQQTGQLIAKLLFSARQKTANWISPVFSPPAVLFSYIPCFMDLPLCPFIDPMTEFKLKFFYAAPIAMNCSS